MDYFLEGLIAGYGIAIPVGAISVLIVGIAMRSGLRAGLTAGAGAATADLIYVVIAAVSGTLLADWLRPYFQTLQIASGIVLIGLGLWGLCHGLRAQSTDSHESAIVGTSFMYFQLLGLTLLNPLTVVYFAALVFGSSTAPRSVPGTMLFVLGASLASLSWQWLLAAFGALGRSRLPASFQRAAVLVGNVVVILLGLRIWFS
jgi:threonine/homoserine/homoserine lactone efflux protein